MNYSQDHHLHSMANFDYLGQEAESRGLEEGDRQNAERQTTSYGLKTDPLQDGFNSLATGLQVQDGKGVQEISKNYNFENVHESNNNSNIFTNHEIADIRQNQKHSCKAEIESSLQFVGRQSEQASLKDDLSSSQIFSRDNLQSKDENCSTAANSLTSTPALLATKAPTDKLEDQQNSTNSLTNQQ